jgi:prevent-host-death family protein
MQTILADLSISMSDFKKNPAQVLRTAGEKPVAVLNHNRPAFYMVSPKLFEALIEEVAKPVNWDRGSIQRPGWPGSSIKPKCW